MADQDAQITKAVAAIRQAAESDLAISQSAVLTIEQHVNLIVGLTGSAEVKREGEYLVSRALGRYVNSEPRPMIVLDARMQGAVARFEFCLRRLGYLPPAAVSTKTASGKR